MITSPTMLTRARRIKSLVRRPVLSVYQVEGDMEGKPLRVVVADDGVVLDMVRSVFFRDNCRVMPTGRVSIFGAPQLAISDADVVVIGANHYLLSGYQGLGFRFVPRFVSLRLRIYDSPSAMIDNLPSSAREDLRRNVRRMLANGFTYELTNEPAWFETFYHDMYKPYAKERFGELARVHGYRRVRYDFQRGVGISLQRNGELVAGAVSYFTDSTMMNFWKGTLHGDQTIAREGASTALYYYRMEIAWQRGCKMANFGYSSPFLSDGALSYKLKWGMEVAQADNSRGLFAIATPGNTDQGMRFLQTHRFFCLRDDGIALCDDH